METVGEVCLLQAALWAEVWMRRSTLERTKGEHSRAETANAKTLRSKDLVCWKNSDPVRLRLGKEVAGNGPEQPVGHGQGGRSLC